MIWRISSFENSPPRTRFNQLVTFVGMFSGFVTGLECQLFQCAEKDAARAYDAMAVAVELFGDDACLNFPPISAIS